MTRLKNKKYLNLSIDSNLLEMVRPYINNISAFVETCLKNFYQKNKDIINEGDIKTSKYLVDLSIKTEELPNITYIMQHLPIQLELFPIIENRVINNKNKRFLTLPGVQEPIFLSNNSLKLNDKIYYFEINSNYTSQNNKSKAINDNYVYDESDKWW